MADCRTHIRRWVFYFAVITGLTASPQEGCNVTINNWSMVMHLLMCAKYLAIGSNPEPLDAVRLILGAECVNFFLLVWVVKGIVWLSIAEGKSCFLVTSRPMMIAQVVIGCFLSVLLVALVLLLFLFVIFKGLIWVLGKIIGPERVSQIRLFRALGNIIRLRQPQPFLQTLQVSDLKAKIERLATVSDVEGPAMRDNPCPICLEQFEVEQAYLPLVCGHNFHSNCLDVWLSKKSTCPLCVREVKLEDYNTPQNTSLEETVGGLDDHSQLEMVQNREDHA